MPDLASFELDGIYYAILFAAALLAGFIDSIVGGGGLITLPALMACGVPPHLAVATNKLGSTFGVLTATLTYFKSLTMPRLAWGIICTLLGAVQMDDTGSTRIGKYIFNHAFLLPGVLAIALSVALGFLVVSLV